MEGQRDEKEYRNVIILLGIGSLLLFANSAFTIQLFSVQYGVGAGGYIQSQADKLNVTKILIPFSSQLNSIYTSILESYLTLGITLVLVLITTMLMLRRSNKYDAANRGYALLHMTLVIVYVVLFFIIYTNFTFDLYTLHLYFTYFGILLCLA